MNIDISFSRELLRTTLEEVKPLTSAAERKAAWVYDFGHGHWEFHGPDQYYWHGSASNAYEARANGWSAWRESLKAEAEAQRAREYGKALRREAVK